MPERTKTPRRNSSSTRTGRARSKRRRKRPDHAAEAEPPAEPSAADRRARCRRPTSRSWSARSTCKGRWPWACCPTPSTNKADVQLDQAKHAIDLLTMLQQKTEGNRTPDESEELEAVLHELRLAFVTVSEAEAAKK